MITSSKGRLFIESFEGLSLKTYNDGTGVLTIGYGHTTSAGPPRVTKGQTITKEQADQILGNDLGKVEQQVNTLVKVPINQNQFDALVSFQFNTGALGKSTALKKLNQGDYNGAADALLLYNRGGGRVLAGLTRRRQAEQQIFLTPVSNLPQHSGVIATIAAGATAASQAPHYWPWIIGGTVVAAITVWLIIHFYRKGKL